MSVPSRMEWVVCTCVCVHVCLFVRLCVFVCLFACLCECVFVHACLCAGPHLVSVLIATRDNREIR